MRTMITLDDDVAAAIERLRREQGLGISEAVNRLARAGLIQKTKGRPFRQRTERIGVTVDVTDVTEALDEP